MRLFLTVSSAVLGDDGAVAAPAHDDRGDAADGEPSPEHLARVAAVRQRPPITVELTHVAQHVGGGLVGRHEDHLHAVTNDCLRDQISAS